MPLDDAILGKGVYTPREAARLIGQTPQQIIRWTRGSGPMDPLWKAHFHFIEDSREISFLDLIEVRVVDAMRKAGVTMPAVRFARKFAMEKFGIERPLASRKFKTEGQRVLMEAIEEDGEYVDLSPKNAGQKVFRAIVSQSLSDLEYENDLASRWRPAQFPNIVIDPKRYFGDPLLDKHGISTNMLFEESQTFGVVEYLASIYEIPIRDVRQAVKFELSLEEMIPSS